MKRILTSALAGLLSLGAAAWAQDDAVSDAAATDVTVADLPAAIDWPVPTPEPFVCPFSFDYEVGELSCGFISVPENRDNPDSRMIRLNYVKIASTAEDEADVREDPAIYLTGGPGVVLEGYADRLRQHDILLQRDLYILEHRGIGNSGDFCPFFDAVRRDLAWAETPLQGSINAAERMRDCFRTAREAGVDLTGYSTVENARDVRTLRQALGFESWNVWGISYGSVLGQMVLQEDPEGTAAMVIDAIVPNDLQDLGRIGRWVNRVLENLYSTCTDAAVCENLEARVITAMEQLKAERIIVEVDNTELNPEGRVAIGAEIVIFAPFMMMYEQSEHPAIPGVMDTILTAVETGDMSLFELLAGDDDMGGISSSQGMSSAIRCNDGYFASSAAVAAEDVAENPMLEGLGFAEGAAYQAQVCVEEGLIPRRHADKYGLIETDIPVLVVNGAWDPVTPPPLAERIMPGLSNSRYVEVPFAGHGPTRSLPECAGPVMNAFFDNPDPAALDVACLEEGVAQPQYVDFFTSSAVLRAGTLASDDPKNLVPAGIWFALPLLMLIFSAIIYPLAWLARRISLNSAEALSADTAGARWLAWFASLSGIAFPVMVGLGAYEASEISQFAIIAGMTSTASTGAWLALLAGVFGVLALVQLWRARAAGSVRIGSLIGIAITGASAVALAAFAVSWDLAPF
ncbi:alpha/beta hydrolase [Maricaulis sp.]|uniref:alpha/beta hydrolase n=1 Tax=Maricaulis sp. TaxID=1486257 RepID=UPI002609A3B4|nr:alpha/beta hydrolase [Maricaulis sp.]